jgi:hypothetical protein
VIKVALLGPAGYIRQFAITAVAEPTAMEGVAPAISGPHRVRQIGRWRQKERAQKIVEENGCLFNRSAWMVIWMAPWGALAAP